MIADTEQDEDVDGKQGTSDTDRCQQAGVVVAGS